MPGRNPGRPQARPGFFSSASFRFLIPLLLTPLFAALAGCASPEPPYSRCWVHIFESPGFAPDARHDLLFGPARWDSLRQLPNSQRSDWTGAIASLMTGPEAAATLWEESGFAGKAVRLGPDTLLAAPEDLPLRRSGSLAIECLGGEGAPTGFPRSPPERRALRAER